MSIESISTNLIHLISTSCTNCGECCKDEFLFLSDVDVPLLSQHLYTKGGTPLVQEHMMRNRTPFNVFTEYLFHFEGDCPFLVNGQCEIYTNRPYICRIFPLRLLGLFDGPNDELRFPVFTVINVKKKYKCKPQCDTIDSRIMELDRRFQSGSTAKALIVSALMDKKNFGYIFGQRTIRGGDQHFPVLTGTFTTNDVQAYVTDSFRNHSKHLPENWKRYCDLLSKENADKLVSEKFGKKATIKTGKRVRNIQEFRTNLYDWWDGNKIP